MQSLKQIATLVAEMSVKPRRVEVLKLAEGGGSSPLGTRAIFNVVGGLMQVSNFIMDSEVWALLAPSKTPAHGETFTYAGPYEDSADYNNYHDFTVMVTNYDDEEDEVEYSVDTWESVTHPTSPGTWLFSAHYLRWYKLEGDITVDLLEEAGLL